MWSNEEMEKNGEWEVSCDPDVPGMVYLKFSEVSEDGVNMYDLYLPPELADDMAEQLSAMAEHIRECH